MSVNTKNKKTKMNKKKIFMSILSVVVVIAIGLAGVLGYNIYKDTAGFNAERLLSSGATQYVDANNEVFYTMGGGSNGKRKNITYDDLPQILIDAVVSAEDSRFFEHDGFDLARISKAFIGNLVAGGITSGGSTITQQLIKKTYFPDAEKTYTRKISEIILAVEADKALSKEEILTLYLNKIYFGRSTSSIGIAAACKYYFNKDVSQLTLPEAAMLAGSLNSPYNYDPFYNLNKATERRNRILNLMVKHGYITQEECEEAKATKIENTLHASTETNNSVYAAYVDMVTKEIKDKTDYDPEKTQLIVHTYLNKSAQELCTEIGNGQAYDYSDEDMKMGGCVQESQTGRIVAVIGGRNYTFSNLNFATTKQQPGSSVKPFLDYGLAFENLDWCTGQTIKDEPYDKNGYKPKNWDRSYHGVVTVTQALEQSWNVPAVKTFEEVYNKIGKKGVTSAMNSIGISMKGENADNLAYAIGGWEKGISPCEMASAYATISNNGLYTESHTIDYIEVVQTGETINIDQNVQDEATQSDYSEASAFMVREVMLDYTKHHSGNYAYLAGIRNIGAKTGTSNWPSGSSNGKGGKSRDIWMSAFTSDYVCSVWMGFDKTGIDKGKTTSGYKAYPGKVVAKIIKFLQTDGTEKEYPSQPKTVEKDGDEYVKVGTKHKHNYSYSTPAEEQPAEQPTEGQPAEEQPAQQPTEGQSTDHSSQNNQQKPSGNNGQSPSTPSTPSTPTTPTTPTTPDTGESDQGTQP